MTSRIKNISLPVPLQRESKRNDQAVIMVKESRMAKKRRIIKRLQLITEGLALLRIVLLFAIAAIAAAALLNIFLKQL